MPKPFEYTPSRRRTLQVVIALILLATVGLAALVGAVKRRASRVEFSPNAVTSGDITVRLPARWRSQPGGDDPRAVAVAEEVTGSRDAPRRLTVMFESVDTPASPVQYLIERFRLPIASISEDQQEIVRVEPATVAGQVGVLVSIDSLRLGEGMPQLPQKDIYAAAILPSRRAVVVHLRGFGRPDLTDRALVRQVAAAISVKNEPALAPQASGAIALPSGTRITPPAGFVAVQSSDPLRTDRLLWPAIPDEASTEQREAFWTTIEVLECLFPSSPDAASAEALRTLLLVRDPAWRGATITSEANTWRAELGDSTSPGGPFRSVAFLHTGPGGRALLAIFRGGFGAGMDFDATWKELAASVQFAPAPPLTAMQAAGAAAAARVRDIGYGSALADRTEQWWLCTDASNRPHRAWSHLEFDSGAGAAGEVRAHCESRRRRDGGAVTRLTSQFRYADGSGQYESDLTRNDVQGTDTASSIRQMTTLRDGQLTIAVSTPSHPIGQWKSPPPVDFIPGALLPLVMDQFLAADHPVLIRSESFLGVEGIGPPQPLTILLRPMANTTRKAEGETQPMRCLEAEVNGSGVASRWYFRKSGAVECVDLPAGVQRTASDSNAVRFAFDQDPQMSPP